MAPAMMTDLCRIFVSSIVQPYLKVNVSNVSEALWGIAGKYAKNICRQGCWTVRRRQSPQDGISIGSGGTRIPRFVSICWKWAAVFCARGHILTADGPLWCWLGATPSLHQNLSFQKTNTTSSCAEPMPLRQQWGRRWMFLPSWSQNISSLDLSRRLGFVVTGLAGPRNWQQGKPWEEILQDHDPCLSKWKKIHLTGQQVQTSLPTVGIDNFLVCHVTI